VWIDDGLVLTNRSQKKTIWTIWSRSLSRTILRDYNSKIIHLLDGRRRLSPSQKELEPLALCACNRSQYAYPDVFFLVTIELLL